MANTTLHFSLLSTTRIKAGFQLVFTGDGVGVEVRVDCSQPGGGGGTPLHYQYGYVPPNGVVIFKLLI